MQSEKVKKYFQFTYEGLSEVYIRSKELEKLVTSLFKVIGLSNFMQIKS